MTARSTAADAYAAQAVTGDPGAPWVVNHGGDITTDDARQVAEDAFAAGAQWAEDRIKASTD